MSDLAIRMSQITESVTLKLNALANEMIAKGEKVINLTAGEPDFNAPEESKEAVREALKNNLSKYTPVPGVNELRALVAEKTNRQQPAIQEKWKSDHVVISNGGKQAIFNSFMALLNPGDEVLIPAPYWLTYPELVKLAEGVPKFLKTTSTSDFKMTPEELKEAITPKTKILILNSPSNPTGSIYSSSEYEKIGEVLKSFPHLWVLSDEIYDRIHYGEIPFCSFLAAAPFLRDQTITVNGMSKSASMTGWRVGWTVSPLTVAKAISKFQGQTTSGINSLAQAASIAGLKIPDQQFLEQIESFRRRRDMVLEILEKSGKIEVCTPRGAFYFFIGIEKALKPAEDSVGFAQRLLEQQKVAVVPGNAFGEPRFVRLSFATKEDLLQEGCNRLVQFVEQSI